jgi:NAD(P)-dependent dehydrogenase (short-subunit alcohol dehydrogenase family)
MPIPFLFHILQEGPPDWLRNNAWLILKTTVTITTISLIKWYSSGAKNTSERDMHGKVVMITGGMSGIGARTALELGQRGAQLVLLTQTAASDPFLAEYVQDLRTRTNNDLIYAEQVDLASLYSIRQFATKWIDNAPPRRLDMIILCAATLTPPGQKKKETREGIEETWMVNFLANFHLLGILSPAIRAQPFDRDVRIIFTTCSSYISSPNLKEGQPGTDRSDWSPGKAYARSKLALMVFAQAFQKHLDAYKRPDELPMNARVVLVDPGFSRTPGMRRWLTRGSLWGLAVYLVAYAFPWLLLKSPNRGAQSILYAAMEPSLGRVGGGKLIKECMIVDCARKDVHDEEVAKMLWEESDKLIEKVEKQQALIRGRKKRQDEEIVKRQKEEEKAKETEELMEAIKKGMVHEAKRAKSRKKGKAVEK